MDPRSLTRTYGGRRERYRPSPRADTGSVSHQPEGSVLLSTSAVVEDSVRDSVGLDPRIPDPEQIAISADGGVVTLRGTVGSFSQRRAAEDDALDLEGVSDVNNELQVRLLRGAPREDADIRGIALQILMWDALVPADLINVKVSDGWVTLTGTVSYQFESDAAYDDVADLICLVAVTNDIKVSNP